MTDGSVGRWTPRSTAGRDPATDAERLAGLLDGRLDRVRRAALLLRVSGDEGAFETLVDAATVLKHLDTDPPPDLPLDGVQWPRRRDVRGAPSTEPESRVSERIRLYLLGAVDLAGVPPDIAAKLLAQPKRMALLAYLALATPRGFHRRDRIVGLLWPELDQDGARASLRKAVHAIRGALGDHVIVGRGDEEIALGPGALWCDAVETDESVDAGRHARALELYRRGDLLPSFFVLGAGDFEDWLARERTALRDKAAAAAWSLATQFAEDGHLTNANRWAKSATALAPSDERMLRRVMLFLESHGDIAAALYVYDDFARRLKRDFGAEPSPESRALSDRLRHQGDKR